MLLADRQVPVHHAYVPPPAYSAVMLHEYDDTQDNVRFVDRQHGGVTSANEEHHEKKQIGGSGS